MVNYTVAFKGHYPLTSGWQVYHGDETGEDDPGIGWTEEIEPFCGNASTHIYHCPSFPDEVQFNYFLGIHWVATQGTRDFSMTQVHRASEYILAGDCTHARLYAPPFGQARLYSQTEDSDKDDAIWKCLSFFGEPYGMNAHRAGNNVLFGDYHVTCYSKFDPRYMTYDPNNPGVDFDQVKPQPDD